MLTRFKPLVYSLLLIAACSPTFNWREVREDAAQMKILLPCHPDEGQRELHLPEGGTIMVKMIGCKAGEVTFALAWAEVLQTNHAEAVLSHWKNATLANAKARSVSKTDITLKGPGVRLNSGVVYAQGAQANGESLEMRGLWFARNNLVYQALVIGPTVPEGLTEAFHSGLVLQ